MANINLTVLWRLLIGAILGLSLTLTLTSCSDMMDIITPSTTPIPAPAANNKMPSTGPFDQCPLYNPANTICTHQYEPVCVKTQVGSAISYNTAGNACSACSTPKAIGYVKGECI